MGTAGEPQMISEPVLNNLISTIQDDKVKYICSMIYQDKYYLAVPTSSNAYNDKVIVYDFHRGNFTVYSGWNIQSLALVNSSDDEPLLYGGSNDGAIYQLLTTNADDNSSGTAQDITCSVESKTYDFGEPTVKKRVKQLTMVTGSDGTNDVTPTVTWKVGENSEESTTINTSKIKEITYIRPSGGWGNNYYVKMSETGQNEFNFYGFEANVRVMRKRRLDD
jgi:hypothetical protein